MIQDYNELFKPYQREGSPLESVISWLTDTTKADKDVIDLVVSETMGMLSQGQDFTGDCACGCSFKEDKYPDAKISHFMLARVMDLKNQIKVSRLQVLQQVENTKLEARQKQLSTFEKDYDLMMNGKWYHKLWNWLSVYKGVK